LTLNISETTKGTAIVAIEGEQDTVPKLSNVTILNDFEWPLTKISRSRYFERQITKKMVQDKAILTMADQKKVVYGLSVGAIFNDLE